jgi:hypothetical protein
MTAEHKGRAFHSKEKVTENMMKEMRSILKEQFHVYLQEWQDCKKRYFYILYVPFMIVIETWIFKVQSSYL